EPGARLVLTHGLRTRPRSTAFFASSPAPTITCGFDVFVHEVIAAITTAPWESSNSSPSNDTRTARVAGGSATATAAWSGTGSPPGACSVVGSLAGNVSAT